MNNVPFTLSQVRPIRDTMTVSRPSGLGYGVPVTWFSLGAGTSITPEYYDCLIGCPLIVAGIIIIWVVRETASFFWESMGRKCLSNPEKCCMYRRKHCAAQKPTVE